MRWMMMIACALCGTGCTNKLETGYRPRTIGANEAERRGYYAAPFSKEAREARQRTDYDTDVRRPGPGY